jgi:hypothetical protein
VSQESLEILAMLPRMASGWGCFSTRVKLLCSFIFLTIVVSSYDIFWLDILPVRWTYVCDVLVLKRPSMLACRVAVETTRTSYGTCFESTRISILWERGFQFWNLGFSTLDFNSKLINVFSVKYCKQKTGHIYKRGGGVWRNFKLLSLKTEWKNYEHPI